MLVLIIYYLFQNMSLSYFYQYLIKQSFDNFHFLFKKRKFYCILIFKKILKKLTLQVTYCKRKKGLLKKSIELSILCDLNIFLLIYDKNQQRVIHYASDQNLDIMELFNSENQREYYSNKDYHRVGGQKNQIFNHKEDKSSVTSVSDEEFKQNANFMKEDDKKSKIFSRKRTDGQVTSRIGNLLQ